jgi:hypothetical protein
MTPQMENDLGFLVRIITLGVKGYLWFIGICIFLLFLVIIISSNKQPQRTVEQIRASQHYFEPLFEKCMKDSTIVVLYKNMKIDYCMEHMMEYKK